jgi:TRAP-type uncharacterized transport system fused permease subunit
VSGSIAIAFALSFLRPGDSPHLPLAAGAGLLLAAALLLLGFAAPRAAFWGMMLTAGVAALQTVLRALGVRLPVPGLRLPGRRLPLPAALESGGRGVALRGRHDRHRRRDRLRGHAHRLGLKISGIIVALSGGLHVVTVLYAAIAVWVLGLAVPVTASYTSPR